MREFKKTIDALMDEMLEIELDKSVVKERVQKPLWNLIEQGREMEEAVAYLMTDYYVEEAR